MSRNIAEQLHRPPTAAAGAVGSFRGGVAGLITLGRCVLQRAADHNVSGAAAELAYYFMLALFPMLIFLTSMVGFLGGARETIFRGLSTVMPPDAIGIVRIALNDAVNRRGSALISIGILGTIWAASAGVSALIDTLNTVFEVKEGRSYWKVKLIAITLTVALSLLVVLGVVLIMFGDRFVNWAAGRLALGNATTLVLDLSNYLIGFVLLLAGLQVMYYFGPDTKREWRWITPGGIFAVLAAVAVSLLLSFYLRFAPSYSATYGSLGAVVVLMLWLYLMGVVIMLGAEINAAVDETVGR
jgi:membrane protein